MTTRISMIRVTEPRRHANCQNKCSGWPRFKSRILPHNDSGKTSSTEPFLRAVFPPLVVIPVGLDNKKFGHPAPEVLEIYTEHDLTILRTDEQGTVELTTDGERLWVETAR